MDQMPSTKSGVSTHSSSSIKANVSHPTSQSRKEQEGEFHGNEGIPNSSQSSKSIDSKVSKHSNRDDKLEKEAEAERKYACDILQLIDSITGEAENLRPKVESFSGSSTDDKEFIYLDEMLMRATVQLDDIDTKGNALIRQERKKAVHYIQKLMKMLDARLKENKRDIVPNKRSCSDSDDDV